MSRLMSWRPIEFDRWKAFALAISDADASLGGNLESAISRLEVSWSRLRADLLDLFVPAGPDGSHSHHHFHAPTDPSERHRVISSAIADYEGALFAFDVALELSAQALYPGDANPWHTLLHAAEATNASNFDRAVLYLQRTVLWARNWAVAHPLSHVTGLTFDNVGNAIWTRHQLPANVEAIPDLDNLLHAVRPDIQKNAHVGNEIEAALALCWIGSEAWKLDSSQRLSFEAARRALTFWLPYPYEVADQTNVFLDGLVAALPDTDFKRLVFGSSPPIRDAEWETDEVPDEKAGPVDWDDELAAVSGDPDGELALFESYLVEYPDNADLLFNVGLARYHLNNYEGAAEAFSRASALAGLNPQYRKVWADSHYNIGAREYNAKNFGTALAHYRRAVDLNPTDLQSIAHLIVATARSGASVTALTVAAKALAKYPHDKEILYNIALALAFVGRFEDARAYAEQVVEGDPNHDAAKNFIRGLPSVD
jgi:tetratricopeptide (TPR) repeat protein